MGDGLAFTCEGAEQVRGGAAGEPHRDAWRIGCRAQGIAQRQQLQRGSTVGALECVIEEFCGDAAAAPSVRVHAGLAAGSAPVVDRGAHAWPAHPITVIVEADQDGRLAAGRTNRRIGFHPCRTRLTHLARWPMVAHWPNTFAERTDRSRGDRLGTIAGAAPAEPAQMGAEAGAAPALAWRSAQPALPTGIFAGVLTVADAPSALPTRWGPRPVPDWRRRDVRHIPHCQDILIRA